MKSIRKGDLLEILKDAEQKTFAQVTKVCKNESSTNYKVLLLLKESETDFMVFSQEEYTVENDEIVSHVKVKNNDYITAWFTLGILQLPDHKLCKLIN